MSRKLEIVISLVLKLKRKIKTKMYTIVVVAIDMWSNKIKEFKENKIKYI